MKPAAVLFDCDGVLVDSEPVGARIVLADLRERGLDLKPEDFDTDFLGSTLTMIKANVEAKGLALPANWPQQIYDKTYVELAKGVALIPGIEAVLDALDAAGIPYAVGSNGQLRKMEITLGQRPGFEARFKGHVYSGQALGAPKPDPKVYLHAAQQLGVAAKDCVVIDDSSFGCLAGVGGGMRTLGFAAHGDGKDLAQVGAEVFHDMKDLPGLLGL